MTLRQRSVAVFAAAVFAVAGQTARAEQAKPVPPSPTLPQQQQLLTVTDDVKVTVKYTGKGTVDANHRIWVWLFTSAEIGPGSIPIDERSIEKNGGMATFTHVSAKPVYVAIAYDEKGGFTGSAPPPSGSPIAFYGAKGPQDKPAPVVPGPKTSISITLTDAQRMQ